MSERKGATMETTAIKTMICSVLATIASFFGSTGYVISILLMCMILDWITGMTASAVMAKNEGRKRKWSSKLGLKGIIKKAMYVVVIIIAILLDMLILKYSDIFGFNFSWTTFFGLLVTLWFVINEIISILENVEKLGVPLPVWLLKLTKLLQTSLDDKAENVVNKIEEKASTKEE